MSRASKESLNEAYIQIFKKNYVLTKGEPDRKSLTSTSEQGSMSIRQPAEKKVQNIIKLLMNSKTGAPHNGIMLQRISDALVKKQGIAEETVFDVLKTHYCYATGGLIVEYYNNSPTKVKTHLYPPHAEIEHVLAWRTMLAIGGGIASIPKTATKDTIKFRETAGLASANWYDELVKDGTGHLRTYADETSFKTIQNQQVQKIESHLTEVKTQLQDANENNESDNISDLLKEIERLKYILNQYIGYTHENYVKDRKEYLTKTNTSRDGAMKTMKVVVPIHNKEIESVITKSDDLKRRFIDSIRHYGIDWLQGSQFIGEYPAAILEDMANRNINIINLMQNIYKIVTNGMWYSCRSWNQIKSEACLVRIVQTGNYDLTFGVYNSGLDVIIRLFLAHIYDESTAKSGPILKNYEDYKVYKYSGQLKTNIDLIYNNGIRKEAVGNQVSDRTMWSGQSYDRQGNSYHYLEGTPNRNYTMDPPEFEWLHNIFMGMSYEQAYSWVDGNVKYVLNRLCFDLNELIYERGYFQAKIMETPYYRHPDGLVAMGNGTMSESITAIVTKPPQSPDQSGKRSRGNPPPLPVPSSAHAVARPVEDDGSSLTMSDLRQNYIDAFVLMLPSSKGGRKKKTKRNKTRKKRRRKKKKRTRRKK